jgi:hypothetical protein
MLICEVTDHLDEKRVWARSGKKVVRKYRCPTGRRKGKVFSTPSKCFSVPDPKKRLRMKMMKAKLSKVIVRKSKRTKKINPASRRVQALNR